MSSCDIDVTVRVCVFKTINKVTIYMFSSIRCQNINKKSGGTNPMFHGQHFSEAMEAFVDLKEHALPASANLSISQVQVNSKKGWQKTEKKKKKKTMGVSFEAFQAI